MKPAWESRRFSLQCSEPSWSSCSVYCLPEPGKGARSGQRCGFWLLLLKNFAVVVFGAHALASFSFFPSFFFLWICLALFRASERFPGAELVRIQLSPATRPATPRGHRWLLGRLQLKESGAKRGRIAEWGAPFLSPAELLEPSSRGKARRPHAERRSFLQASDPGRLPRDDGDARCLCTY